MKAREVFSVKISGDLKRKFMRVVKEKGFSTCFICETLFTAWLEGLEAPKRAKVDSKGPIVINQKIEYQVSRARRRKEGARDQWFNGTNPTNHWSPECGWSFRPDQPLNPNRHVIGCSCRLCHG